MQKLKHSKNHTSPTRIPFWAFSKTRQYHIEQSTWCPKIAAWGVIIGASWLTDPGMCALEDSQGAFWPHRLARVKPHLGLPMMKTGSGEVQMSKTSLSHQRHNFQVMLFLLKIN